MAANRIRPNGKNPGGIHEALTLLNEAAKEKQHELYDALGNKYDDIKQLFCEYGDQGKEAVRQAREKADETLHRGGEKIRQTADEVKARADAIDSKVHEKPWLFLGSIAAGAFVAGYLIRARKKPGNAPPSK